MDALRNFLEWIPLGLPAFLFVITVVVFFHELGHYSVARLFGVRVETFSLGFGRELIGRTDKHGTRWKIGWLPVGGYVRFFGDADAASRPDQEAAQTMSAADRKASLQHKPVWQRSLVVAAGPFANFILAIFIFSVTLMSYGRSVLPPLIGTVTPDSPAAAAGIRPGDTIRSIDGVAIKDYLQVPEIITVSAGQDLEIVLERAGQPVTVHATPRNMRRQDPFGNWTTLPTLGVRVSEKAKPVVVHYGPVEAVGESVKQTWGMITGTLKGIKQIVLGRTDASQLQGPVGTASLTKKVAEFGIIALIQWIALLSVSIGLINLFPIPVLDGGHLLYYGCEAVLGRPLGERAQEVGFRFGLALVLGLMIFSFWNDLAHHLN